MGEAVTELYIWNDRARAAYARLRAHEGHWRLEWGRRDPPGSDEEVQLGEHVTSDPAEAVAQMVACIQQLSPEPDEALRVERELRAVLGLTEEAG
jgi:hypothetical protein